MDLAAILEMIKGLKDQFGGGGEEGQAQGGGAMDKIATESGYGRKAGQGGFKDMGGDYMANYTDMLDNSTIPNLLNMAGGMDAGIRQPVAPPDSQEIYKNKYMQSLLGM